MRGTMWIHAIIGGIAFILTFFTALTGNVWLVSLERAVYAFLFFFLIAYPIRWLLAKVAAELPEAESEQGQKQQEAAGTAAKTDPAEGFEPLSFPEIKRVSPEQNPATVADVIRRLTDE